MSELIKTDSGIVLRGIDDNGALTHKKILPVNGGNGFDVDNSSIFSLAPLTKEEDAQLKNNHSSLYGALKDGILSSVYRYMASTAKMTNSTVKNSRQNLLARIEARRGALNSSFRWTRSPEMEETALEKVIRENLRGDKDDPELIAAKDRWTKQAENRSANQDYYGHKIAGSIAESLTSPMTFIPGFATGRGVKALIRAALADGVLSIADESVRRYGDDTLTTNEKLKKIAAAGGVGALNSVLINLVAKFINKGVNMYEEMQAGKTSAEEAQAASEGLAALPELASAPVPAAETLPGGSIAQGELPESGITHGGKAAEPETSDIEAAPITGQDKAFQMPQTSDEGQIRDFTANLSGDTHAGSLRSSVPAADAPVITLTGKEFGKYKNIKDLRGRISGMFFETLQGGAINREGFGKVRMPEKALRETLDNAGDDELLPVKYIPDIIRKGSLGNEEILKNPREDGIVSLTPIMAIMKDMNGKETSVGVMIGKDEKGRLYYDSFIIK